MKKWCLLMLMTAPAFAAPTAEISTDDPDAPFYATAARSGLAEVEAGMLAQERSKNPQVQEFAAMVVRDHIAANKRLHELAMANQVDLPMAPSPRQAQKKAQLATLSGDDFDRAYIEWQILAHKDAIEVFRRESESRDDKEARQFALDTLPTLRMHLAKLYALPVIPPASPTTPTGAAAPMPPAPASN